LDTRFSILDSAYGGQARQKERRVNFGLAEGKATMDCTVYTDLICHKKAQKVPASDAFSTNLSRKASFIESFVIDYEVNFAAFQQNADSGRKLEGINPPDRGAGKHCIFLVWPKEKQPRIAQITRI